MDKWYYVYILYSASFNRYYIGMTSDLSARIKLHNGNHKGYTGHHNDWQIVYTEEYRTKSEAYKREREIKKWKSRKMMVRILKIF